MRPSLRAPAHQLWWLLPLQDQFPCSAALQPEIAHPILEWWRCSSWGWACIRLLWVCWGAGNLQQRKAVNNWVVLTLSQLFPQAVSVSISKKQATCKKESISHWESKFFCWELKPHSNVKGCVCFKELISFLIHHFTVFCYIDTDSVLGTVFLRKKLIFVDFRQWTLLFSNMLSLHTWKNPVYQRMQVSALCTSILHTEWTSQQPVQKFRNAGYLGQLQICNICLCL